MIFFITPLVIFYLMQFIIVNLMLLTNEFKFKKDYLAALIPFSWIYLVFIKKYLSLS